MPFKSTLLVAVVATALLLCVDNVQSGSLAKRSIARDTCMTRWLRLATMNSTIPVDVARSENALFWMLVSADVTSLSSLDKNTLASILGGNMAGAKFLEECAGDTPKEACLDVDPCRNGASCVFRPKPAQPGADQFSCACSPGYSGKFCQQVLTSCDSNSCGNGGTCVNVPGGGFTCDCTTRFKGTNCQTEWISPQVIANISLTLSRIIGEQQTVDQRLESFSRSSANRISAFLSGLERRLENSMNSRLRSVSQAINALNASTQGAGAKGAGSMMGVSPPGKILDRAKCSSRITVLPNGRVAWNHSPASQNAAVLGVTGYSSGIHRWTFQVNGLVITNGLGVGFTTLPVDGDDYERGWSPSTVYAWFSNQFTGGLARSQTSSTAKMAQWLNSDILTLTLNVEAQTMEMFHHHTKERKTIRGVNNQGKPLYLWIFLGQPRHRIIFLPNSE